MSPSYLRGYDYYDYAGSTAAASGVAAAIASMFTFFILLSFAWYIIQVIAMWKIFTKAGQKGWKSLIPIYNLVIMYKICGITPWLILAYLLVWIPFIGALISIGLIIYQNIMLSKSFGKSGGFAVGLILLSSIFYLILGFGGSTYVGPGGNKTAEVE